MALEQPAAHRSSSGPWLASLDPLTTGLTWREVILVALTVAACVTAGMLWQRHKELLLTSHRGLLKFFPTLFACLTFMVVGPALMMLNKHIMGSMGFHHPIALCSIGLVSSAVISRLLVFLRMGQIREESMRMVSGLEWFRVAGTIGLMKALTMSTGNAVYLHLSFGFIQMLKAFTPFIVMVVMRAFGVRLPNKAAMWCVVAIVMGTMVEVNGELRATRLGLVLMLSSEFFEAISVVMSQKILQHNKFTVLEGMYLTAPAGAVCLLLGASILELPEMVAKGNHLIPLEHPGPFLWAAVLGVAINFVSFMVMQLTSALTMKILNTARSVGLVVIGVLFYNEEHPPLQLAGYALALVGFAGYNYFQMFPEAAEMVGQRIGDCFSDAHTPPEKSSVPPEVLPR